MTPDTPGWYDDPEHPEQCRYWDGEAWREHRSPRHLTESLIRPTPTLGSAVAATFHLLGRTWRPLTVLLVFSAAVNTIIAFRFSAALEGDISLDELNDGTGFRTALIINTLYTNAVVFVVGPIVVDALAGSSPSIRAAVRSLALRWRRVLVGAVPYLVVVAAITAWWPNWGLRSIPLGLVVWSIPLLALWPHAVTTSDLDHPLVRAFGRRLRRFFRVWARCALIRAIAMAARFGGTVAFILALQFDTGAALAISWTIAAAWVLFADVANSVVWLELQPDERSTQPSAAA